jgi:hypothetical protein
VRSVRWTFGTPQRGSCVQISWHRARNSLIVMVRPERFELPASWFVARRDGKCGNFGFCKLLILNNHARGMSVANSPQSTTKHYRITQKSRNHLALLDWANYLAQLPSCGTLNRQQTRPTTWLSRKSPARPVVLHGDYECRRFKSWGRFVEPLSIELK